MHVPRHFFVLQMSSPEVDFTFLSFSTLFFDTESLNEFCTHNHFQLDCWDRKSPEASCLCSILLAYRDGKVGLFMGSGASDSGPHVCISVLPTELSLQPVSCLDGPTILLCDFN